MSAPGPLIVTQRRPVAPDENGTPYCGACSHYHEGACLCPDCGRPTPCRDHSSHRSVSTPATEIVSHEAFATREDGVRFLHRITGEQFTGSDWSYDQCVCKFPAAGGKVPLPNGDVIEVEATYYNRLAHEAGFGAGDEIPLTNVCAAWNAEHGIGLEARA